MFGNQEKASHWFMGHKVTFFVVLVVCFNASPDPL